MADLVAADVVATIQSQTISNMSVKSIIAKLVFGDGSKTYPTGGIPLTKGGLGLPNSIMSFEFIDLGTAGYVCSYDYANEKLRLLQSASHTHNLFLKDADQVDAAGNRVNAATDKLGGNTGSSITVTGQAAGASAHGGILGIAAGVLSELSGGSSAVANNTTIYVRVMGY